MPTGNKEIIRPFTADDYDAVYALWRRTAGMALNDKDDSRAGITQYLARNPRTCFVAEADGRIVGAILSGHDGRRGFIYHTCVAEDARCQGLGTRLTEKALGALRTEGINKVALLVVAGNNDGNEFWEHRGFTPRPDLVYRDKALVELHYAT